MQIFHHLHAANNGYLFRDLISSSPVISLDRIEFETMIIHYKTINVIAEFKRRYHTNFEHNNRKLLAEQPRKT